MAGSYPDAPSRRMAWDADGSVGIARNAAFQSTELTGSETAELNDEDNTASTYAVAGGGSPHYVIVIFPELREIDGVFAAAVAGIGAFEASDDTTNGIDGTWDTVTANMPDEETVFTRYRVGIVSAAETARRGLRVVGNQALLQALHIYGTISPGETPDRLLWLDEATGLEFTAPRDYGDRPRGSSLDYELRLRNNSATLTANTIQYTAEDLFLGSAAWYTWTLPAGSTFQSVRSIASLAPATTTGLIVLRQIIPGTTVPQHYAARARAAVSSWS